MKRRTKIAVFVVSMLLSFGSFVVLTGTKHCEKAGGDHEHCMKDQ